MPNIAIYEGGKAARMNGVSVITTDGGNGRKVEWVPQSERQTGTLYVSKNGTYMAEEEGIHSWSKVTVRLAGAPLGLEVPTLPDPITGAEIPTGEEGELDPVAPAGLEPIEDDPISADEAESIIEEAGLDPSDLDPDSPNYDDAMEAIADALGTDPEDVKVIDPEDQGSVADAQPKVEDNGQEIVGTDPNTGDQVTVTPSGKDTRPTPKAIVITKLPNRLSYSDGDTIDFTGIEVKLYLIYEESGSSVDATPFRDSRYPDGVIPFDELIFPKTTAEFSDNGDTVVRYDESSGFGRLEGVSGVSVPQAFSRGIGSFSFHTAGYIEPSYVSIPSDAYAVCYGPNPTNRFITFSIGEPSSVSGNTFNLSAGYESITVNGVTYYATSIWNGRGSFEEFDIVIEALPPVDWPLMQQSTAMRDLLRICYGGQRDTSDTDIPVQWVSPYDGDTLETSFSITVTE